MDSTGEMRIHAFICRQWEIGHGQKEIKKIIPFWYVKRAACDATGADPDLVFTNTRKQPMVFARYLIAIYQSSNTTDSLEFIGGLIGGKDHSTIIHAEKEYLNMSLTNEHFRACIQRFIAILNLDFPEKKYRYSMETRRNICKN